MLYNQLLATHPKILLCLPPCSADLAFLCHVCSNHNCFVSSTCFQLPALLLQTMLGVRQVDQRKTCALSCKCSSSSTADVPSSSSYHNHLPPKPSLPFFLFPSSSRLLISWKFEVSGKTQSYLPALQPYIHHYTPSRRQPAEMEGWSTSLRIPLQHAQPEKTADCPHLAPATIDDRVKHRISDTAYSDAFSLRYVRA